jgi:hypothetical protein
MSIKLSGKNRSMAFQCRVRSLQITTAMAFLMMQSNIVGTISLYLCITFWRLRTRHWNAMLRFFTRQFKCDDVLDHSIDRHKRMLSLPAR